MADSKNVNLDDLPYDEYQEAMARMEAEEAQAKQNADLGIEKVPENDEHSGFDDFMAGQKSDVSGNDDVSEGASPAPSDVVGDQAGDKTTGEPDEITKEGTPDAFDAKQSIDAQAAEQASLREQGIQNTVSGAFQNAVSGIKGLFSSGAMGTARTIANTLDKFGIPRAATYSLLFILGGGTFAGIAALLGANNNSYKYGAATSDCTPTLVRYHENAVYKAPTQDQLDGRAGALFNALNSDMHFKYGIRNGGTKTGESIMDDVSDDGYSYHYHQDPEDRYDWNEDGKIDEKDDKSRSIKGGYHNYDHMIKKFQDEQILGMIMAASAESHINPSTYEMNYRVGPPSDDAIGQSSDFYLGLSDNTRDMILSRTHHVQWNAYCQRMFALYANEGLSVSTDTYKYLDQWGNSTNEEGQQNYYPGVGLWQWTGQRGYNLHWFSNQLEHSVDSDGDGANDAMYSLNVQIAYLLEIEANPVVVNGTEIPIVDWGQKETATYQVEYYVNVPYKPNTSDAYDIGTAPGSQGNWIPMSDYQKPSERGLQVPWDAYKQLRESATYKYESKSGARVSDKNYDEHRDGAYYLDSDKYDGTMSELDDSPFPVKDYVYNESDSTIMKSTKYKHGTGSISDGTEPGDANDDGVVDEGETVAHYEEVEGYDKDGDGEIGKHDYIRTDNTLYDNYADYKSGANGHEGFDLDDDGSVDVWDMNKNGEVDEDEDWYVDHIAYGEGSDWKDQIFHPELEVYYQNIGMMVLACAPGDYNSSKYIYEEDGHCLRQYKDTETQYDYSSDKTKIIYQSPGITAMDIWETKPWGDGTYQVIPEQAGSTAYKAIQKDDKWWDQLESARKLRMQGDSSKYGKEIDESRDSLREVADEWRDEIWIWTNAHARGMVGRNKGLEFCLGWLGCPEGMIERHTMFVTGKPSFAGRLDITRYAEKADCIEHYAECMLGIDWHGNETTGKGITDIMYEDMSTRYVNNVRHQDESVCGGDFDNSSIAACAVSWAWLKGHEADADVNLAVLDPGGCAKAFLCTSLYCAVHDIVYQGDPYYSSCDRGAATAVVASGSDDDYKAGSPYVQFDYMRSKPALWQDCGDLSSVWGSSMEPGDIICSTAPDPRHIIVFVGQDAVHEKWGSGVGNAEKAIVHSSRSSKAPRGPRCDLDGSFLLSDSSHAYHVFRCMNPDVNSSTKKADVDAQASFLGGLNNGDGKGGGYYAPQY